MNLDVSRNFHYKSKLNQTLSNNFNWKGLHLSKKNFFMIRFRFIFSTYEMLNCYNNCSKLNLNPGIFRHYTLHDNANKYTTQPIFVLFHLN